MTNAEANTELTEMIGHWNRAACAITGRNVILMPVYKDLDESVYMTHDGIVNAVKAVVSKMSGYEESEIFSKARHFPFPHLRMISATIIRDMSNRFSVSLSWKKLGKYFGIDHSTAMHLVRTYNDLYEVDKPFRALADKCKHEMELTIVRS